MARNGCDNASLSRNRRRFLANTVSIPKLDPMLLHPMTIALIR